jgi:hypothetical protein
MYFFHRGSSSAMLKSLCPWYWRLRAASALVSPRSGSVLSLSATAAASTTHASLDVTCRIIPPAPQSAGVAAVLVLVVVLVVVVELSPPAPTPAEQLHSAAAAPDGSRGTDAGSTLITLCKWQAHQGMND